MKRKVLVVDDEARMRSLLTLHLRRAFDVKTAASGDEAWRKMQKEHFDAMILDILMPESDGREVCRKIREQYNVPILMLTALADVEEKLEAFDAGADDYVTKPFDPRELIARVEALIRRSEGRKEEPEKAFSPVTFGKLTIDPARRAVYVDDVGVALTPKEFDLIDYLARSPGRAFSREELLQDVWRDAAFAQTRTVDSHVKTLREKLGRNGLGKMIVTVWGVGYKFDPSTD